MKEAQTSAHGCFGIVAARLVLILAAFLANALAGAGDPVNIHFTDVTLSAVGTSMDSTIGAALGDFNGDGYLDIFCSEANKKSHLYMSFSPPAIVYQDAALQSGLAFNAIGFDTNAIAWDFDNNGLLDLFVSHGSDNLHMVNEGNGTYLNYALTSGLRVSGNTHSVTPIDFDRDGRQDLLIACGAWNYGGPVYLMRNKGDGTFVNVTAAAGFGGIYVGGGGALAVDFDLDGKTDICLVHYGGLRLYRNNGNGTFAELQNTGLEVAGYANGAAVGDYDNDGDMDIFVASNAPVKMFRNNLAEKGTLTFADTTTLAGVNDVLGAGADAAFGDMDNDGYLDLLVATYKEFDSGKDYLYHNNGNGTFTDVTMSAGLTVPPFLDDTACTFADLDNDGRLDIITTGINHGIVRNTSTNTGHWLEIQLRGTRSNRDAVGAQVTLEAGGKRQYRQKLIGKPRGSQESPRLHFGLGDYNGPLTVRVLWPSGGTDAYHVAGVDRIVSLEQKPASVSEWSLFK
jgi:hypothetical protein